MEQELMDFDTWLAQQCVPEVEYYAEYDDDGMVKSIGPLRTIAPDSRTIKVDTEVATSILEGHEHIFSYRVDVRTKQFVKMNKFATHTLTKIDDVLHRVIDRKWSKAQSPDIVITHNAATSELKFSMDVRYKKMILEGDTDMSFLITDYNDPNILRRMITFKVGDIVNHDKVYTLELPAKFSIYTRRIFDQYVMDIL